jgi:RHS repeat-associated protein
VPTRFAYDGQNVWADLDGSNNLQVRYLYGDGVDQILARIVSNGQPNAGVAWYLADRLGSVRDLENGSSQAVGDHLDYDGYGNTTETQAPYGDRFKYTARENDADTGLNYNRSRYYSSTLGRWISKDPIGFSAHDPNLYRYVLNAPSINLDPSGENIDRRGLDPRLQLIITRLQRELWSLVEKLQARLDESTAPEILLEALQKRISANPKIPAPIKDLLSGYILAIQRRFFDLVGDVNSLIADIGKFARSLLTAKDPQASFDAFMKNVFTPKNEELGARFAAFERDAKLAAGLVLLVFIQADIISDVKDGAQVLWKGLGDTLKGLISKPPK